MKINSQIIIFILLITSIYFIIKNIDLTQLNLEKFNPVGEATSRSADRLLNDVNGQQRTINSLKSDPTLVSNSERELEESKKINDITVDNFDKYFNESHGKFVKYKNRNCDYLDISNVCTVEDTKTCKLNCAQNCDEDPNCISFEFNKKDKTCRLSSSCYSQNIKKQSNKDIYFKRGATIPSIVQFTKIPEKSCPSNSRINTFNGLSLNQCAKKCINKSNCMSFQYNNNNNNNNNNKCILQKNCHKFNYQNQRGNIKSDVFFKNNVKVFKDIKNVNLPCKTNKSNNYDKFVHFDVNPRRRWHIFSYPINSKKGSKNKKPWIGRKANDRFNHVDIPPRSRLYTYQHSNYRGRRHTYNNYHSDRYIRVHLGKLKDRVSSLQIYTI